jgi:hypothetical protein
MRKIERKPSRRLAYQGPERRSLTPKAKRRRKLKTIVINSNGYPIVPWSEYKRLGQEELLNQIKELKCSA